MAGSNKIDSIEDLAAAIDSHLAEIIGQKDEPPPGWLSVADYAQQRGVSASTARSRIKRLLSAGVLERVKVGNVNYYRPL